MATRRKSRKLLNRSQIHENLTYLLSPRGELMRAHARPWTTGFSEVHMYFVQCAKNAWRWAGLKRRAEAALCLISAKKEDRWDLAGANTTGTG